MVVSKSKDDARDRHQLPPSPRRATKKGALFGPVNLYARLLQSEFRLDELESLSKSTRAKYDGLVELYNGEIKSSEDPLLKDDPESVRIVYNWVYYVRNGTHGWDAETQLVNTKHMKKILELRPVELTEEVEKGLNEFIRRREPKAKMCRKKPIERSKTANSRREGTSLAVAARAVARSNAGNHAVYTEERMLKQHAQTCPESRGPVERMNGNNAVLQPTHDEYDAWTRQNATSGHVRSKNQSWSTLVKGEKMTFCFQGDPTELQRFKDVMEAAKNDFSNLNCLCMNEASCAMFTCLAVEANKSELFIRSCVAAVIRDHQGELCDNGYLGERQPDRVVNDLETGRGVGGLCELVICAVLLRVPIMLFGLIQKDLPVPPLTFRPTINKPWAHVVRGQDRVGSAKEPIVLWYRRAMDDNGEEAHHIDLICNVSSYASGGTLAGGDNEDSKRHSNVGLKRRRSEDESRNKEKRQIGDSLSSRKKSRQKSANIATSVRKQSDTCDNTSYHKGGDARIVARAKETKASAQDLVVQGAGGVNNSGWDDENHDYIITKGEMVYNRYKIIERIGKGSFGQVVRAEDTETHCEVAIKIIKSKKGNLMQAKTEIGLLIHLWEEDPDDQHNIVRLLTHFMYRNHQCLVFEMLSLSLYDLLKNTQFGGVSLHLVRKLGKQVLQSLAFLATSDVDIIHCDLKPENILLRHPKKSMIKVIDFGSSCRSNERMYSYIQSLFYRAPEVMLGLPYSCAIDMWSLGCILAEMHTGQPLFDGSDQFDLMQKFVKLLGMVPPDMLDRSTDKVKLQFFEKIRSPSGQEEWQLRQTKPSTSTSPSDKKEAEAESATSETTGWIVPSTDPMASLKSVIVAGNKQKKRFPMSATYNSAGNYDLFFDLLYKMLAYRPEDRITPEEALSHPFIVSFNETG